RWKFRLGSLGLGVLAAGAIFGASLTVSDDLRLMYLVGVIVLFCAATWMGRQERARPVERLSVIPAVGGHVWLLRLGSVAFPMAASVVMGPHDCDRIVSGGCPAEPQGHDLRRRHLVRPLGLVLHDLHSLSHEAGHASFL